jgi:hypothetical protein
VLLHSPRCSIMCFYLFLNLILLLACVTWCGIEFLESNPGRLVTVSVHTLKLEYLMWNRVPGIKPRSSRYSIGTHLKARILDVE